ncbi:MAG TPA: MerC family mercury resistance protein [Pyrinomonadaceae bacterium]|nr:MerC family mercury resistance protein [Pyrinomonadaceae bacterium]
MALNLSDKIGPLIAAAPAPCCFLFLGALVSIPKLSFFAPYEDYMIWVMQGLVLLALVGSLISYRRHRKVAPVILAIASTSAIIYGINANLDTYYIYGGMVGLLVVSTWNSIEAKKVEAPAD